MTKILITGAGGFVGTYLIKELQKSEGNEIYGAVFAASSDITSLLPSDHIVEGDLSDSNFATQLVQTAMPDIVYHLAALSVVGSSVDKAVSVMNTNTTISYNILEAVKNIAPKARFIAIASANEYGAVEDVSKPIGEDTPLRPLNPYAVSKVSQEMLALMYQLAYGLDVVILRPFNHTGIGQTTEFVIPKLAEQFARIEKGQIGPVIEVGNLDTVRDFTDVRDMVSAYALAGQSGKSGEIYNLGSGTGHTIKEILDVLQSLSAVKVEIKVKDELVRSADVPILICDSSKFSALTGWKPTITLNQTISDILNYYREK
ncbi:MAG: GDP-mannose 4,6-dehydratase [Microgenomates group bacterium]